MDCAGRNAEHCNKRVGVCGDEDDGRVEFSKELHALWIYMIIKL